MRSTKQRNAITSAIESLEGFHSAQEIYALLKQQRKSVGLATVYRTLSAMAEKEEVDAITLNNEVLYRRCSPGHHHHIRCRSCGTTIEVEAEAVEKWATDMAQLHGFREISHSIEVSGVCSSCR